MIGKKWKDFRDAGRRLRDVRAEFNDLDKNFRCFDRNKNWVCAGDPCYNNDVEIPRCRQYELNVHCPETQCPYHDWNTKHYYAYVKLWNAEMDRFEAFFNLFVIKRKSKNK